MNGDEDKDKKTPLDPELERVIDKISTEHGFDVRGYRRSTLYRRIHKRMEDAACATAEDYLIRLEADRQEHAQLINTILINVTRLFRDEDAWQCLKERCLAPLQLRRGPGETIRAWSAGCATGEEAYTLAMCIVEQLGEGSMRDVKIYATDVDEGALAPARAGVLPSDALEELSPERRERFFEAMPGGVFKIRRDLRSMVIFGRHNLLQDPPISRLDLLVCRNLLIYLDNDTQGQLLTRFHYALRPEGYLFLGKAETLMARSKLFQPIEARFRIFQRGSQPGVMEGPIVPHEARGEPRPAAPVPAPAPVYTLQTVVSQATDPMVVLDPGGRILMASEPAKDLLHITGLLLGRNFLDLEERFRPVPLRLAIEEVRATLRPARVDEIQIVRADGSAVHLSVDVQPLLDARGELGRILFWAHDTSREHRLAGELAQVRHDLETANEELQCTNEELETANEELQCTNEELETTNEELQSTNEELETTVEELQSTNEELETANEELRTRQEEMNALTRYQDMVLAGLQTGLIVLNKGCGVTSWNKRCEETWGLRDGEVVGKDFFTLDFGLPTASLREPLQRLLTGKDGAEELEIDATNRRGRAIRCHVRVHPLIGGAGDIAGAMLILDEKQGEGVVS